MRDVIYVTEFGDWGMYQRVRLYDTTNWTELDWELLESAPASERQARAAEIVAYRAAIKSMVADQSIVAYRAAIKSMVADQSEERMTA